MERAAERVARLDKLAHDIRERYDTVTTEVHHIRLRQRRVSCDALELGSWLNQAKELVGHGRWLVWLTANCPDVSEKTCQNYMRIAKANPQALADLGTMSLKKLYLAVGILDEEKPASRKALVVSVGSPAKVTHDDDGFQTVPATTTHGEIGTKVGIEELDDDTVNDAVTRENAAQDKQRVYPVSTTMDQIIAQNLVPTATVNNSTQRMALLQGLLEALRRVRATGPVASWTRPERSLLERIASDMEAAFGEVEE